MTNNATPMPGTARFQLSDELAAEAIAKLFLAGRLHGETAEQIAENVEALFRLIDPARVGQP